MSKVVIPCLLETILVVGNDPQDSIHFMGCEACVSGDRAILQPDFELLPILEDMDVRRLSNFLRVEEEAMAFP
jgi:hypothetical protein